MPPKKRVAATKLRWAKWREEPAEEEPDDEPEVELEEPEEEPVAAEVFTRFGGVPSLAPLLREGGPRGEDG